MEPNRFESETRPLCKFGPGGDYVSTWPGNGKSYSEKNNNALSKVLSTVASILGAVIKADMLSEMETQVETEAAIIAKLAEDKIAGKYEQPEPTDNTTSTCGTKSDSLLRKEPLLFGDDCGISNTAKRKSNHRVRTHRRTTRKKAAQWDKGQGTLFETYETSQSAA
jgi:hypothetical protein